MSGRWRGLGLLAAWASSLWLLLLPRGLPPLERPAGLGRRLLGPVASLVASAQWVRFDAAARAGQGERALALAEAAIELDPGAWQGWFTLASHLIYDRGAEALEAEPARQREWIRAGLDLLVRGSRVARESAELEIVLGSSLTMMVALRAVPLQWPGGARAALEEGSEALERARLAGHPHATAMLTEAREHLAVLAAGGWPADWPADLRPD